jgi:hypothetical protein
MLLSFLATCVLLYDMDSATDTDSEVGDSGVASYPTRLASSPSFGSVHTDKRPSLKDVHAALQDLEAVDTRLLIKVTQHTSWKRIYVNYSGFDIRQHYPGSV